MSIEVSVELRCDECAGSDMEDERFDGSSVAEVKALARAAGWTLNHNGEFCRCNVRGWSGKKYQPRKGDVDRLAEERAWREEMARQ